MKDVDTRSFLSKKLPKRKILNEKYFQIETLLP